MFLSLGCYRGLSILTVVLCLLCYSNPFPDPVSVPGLLPWSQHPHCCSLPSLFIVTPFPDSISVTGLLPRPQHPHCCSLPSLLIVTLSQILFLSLSCYLGISILTVVPPFLIVILSQILFLFLGYYLGLSILSVSLCLPC